MRRTILAGLIALCFMGSCTCNTIYCQTKRSLTALDDYINLKLDRDHIPGLAACIINDDSVVWSKGFGFRDLEHKIAMTSESVMGIASVTKLVTAIATMQLVERRKLSLDAPINDHIPFPIHHPEYPDADITVAQLLSHTSSISNGPSLWRSYSCEGQPLNHEEWAKAYFLPDGQFYHKEGNFARPKPGEGFQYSNAGYALLAYVVQAASGMPLEAYCRENIFTPLQMHSTSFSSVEVPAQFLSTMYSYGYNMDLERDLMKPGLDCRKVIQGNYFFPLCNYTAPTIGAGGLYSSTQELSHLLIALMHGGVWKGHRILSPESVERLLSPYVDASRLPGQFAAFGLGAYAMRLNNGEPVWGHTGADPGMSSYLLFNPETKLGAIVLANRFVDIRDLIEWVFAEGIRAFAGISLLPAGTWSEYAGTKPQHKVVFRVVPNYLPGDSRVYVVGNHRFLGCWVSSGIPLEPQRDRSWETTMYFPDSTRIEFKITRGDMRRQAVTIDGKESPNSSCLVVRDTVLNIIVEDWKDQAQQ